MSYKHSHNKARGERDDLTGEHRFGDAGQIVLACLFVVTWIADAFFFKHTTFLNRYMALTIRIPLGIVLLILSGYLGAKAHDILFGKDRETSGVIREGVFNIVRHPLYLSEVLLYLGLLLLRMSLVALVVWIIAIGFLHYISRYEEELLLSRFGEEYEQYMRDVPMWIPRFRK